MEFYRHDLSYNECFTINFYLFLLIFWLARLSFQAPFPLLSVSLFFFFNFLQIICINSKKPFPLVIVLLSKCSKGFRFCDSEFLLPLSRFDCISTVFPPFSRYSYISIDLVTLSWFLNFFSFAIYQTVLGLGFTLPFLRLAAKIQCIPCHGFLLHDSPPQNASFWILSIIIL